METILKQLKNRTALVILLTGLFVGSLVVDFGQLLAGRGFSARAVNTHTVLETDLATWVAYTDPKVGVTVLTLSECEECFPEELLIWLRRVIPTMEVQTLDVTTGTGKTLAAKLGITNVPAFVFENSVRKSAFYQEAQSLFTESDGLFLFDSRALGLATGRFLYDPPSAESDIVLGARTGVPTVVSFIDVSCEACGKFIEESVLPLVATGKAEFRIKLIAVQQTKQIRAADTAILCAAREEKGEAMLREVLRTRNTWTRITDPTSYFVGSAVRAKLDIRSFLSCQKELPVDELIGETRHQAEQYFVEKSPTTIVRGRTFVGAVTKDQLLSVLTDEAR